VCSQADMLTCWVCGTQEHSDGEQRAGHLPHARRLSHVHPHLRVIQKSMSLKYALGISLTLAGSAMYTPPSALWECNYPDVRPVPLSRLNVFEAVGTENEITGVPRS